MSTTQCLTPSIHNFYGLLEPDCIWGITQSGDDFRVVLKGSMGFLKRNVTLFASFGDAQESEHVGENVVTVSMTEKKLMETLNLYFYGQLFQQKAEVKTINDEEGDFLDVEVLNEEALQSEASRIAAAFRTDVLVPRYSLVYQAQSPISTAYSIGRIGAESLDY